MAVVLTNEPAVPMAVANGSDHFVPRAVVARFAAEAEEVLAEGVDEKPSDGQLVQIPGHAGYFP